MFWNVHGLVLYPLGPLNACSSSDGCSLSLAPPEDHGLRSSAAAQRFPPVSTLAHVEKSFNLCDHHTGFIFHLDHEGRLTLLERLQLLPNLLHLCVGQTKFRTDGSAARLPVADGRGLVPHNVIAPQVMQQHEHIESVGHGKQRTSKVRADVIGVPETELHFDVDGFHVRSDTRDPNSRAQKRRPQVDPAAKMVGASRASQNAEKWIRAHGWEGRAKPLP